MVSLWRDKKKTVRQVQSNKFQFLTVFLNSVAEKTGWEKTIYKILYLDLLRVQQKKRTLNGATIVKTWPFKLAW